MTDFSPEGLARAVQRLFELNQFDVTGPFQFHGAEVDLRAQPIGQPFANPIYMEVTTQYVDNTKYGQDVGKLAMVGKHEPRAELLIVSSRGFSLPVKERAESTGITTITYDELFKKFEQFHHYLNLFREDEDEGRRFHDLERVYEEPLFDDTHGKDYATQYLTEWLRGPDDKAKWLFVVGEYGTGKTALTEVLQLRWVKAYEKDASHPIPFRIELRNFTRQFDARGLLHHFLDSNGLGHLSVDFVQELIRSGRVVLLLDGYDEMAQYLHARERRACLEALADLAAGGARGIMTSRPNYFTEAEELQVFEVLYSSLQKGGYRIGRPEKDLLEREKRVDQLLEQFLYQSERVLKDLTPSQTRNLIQRRLEDDEEGADVVLRILDRITRTSREGTAVSLAGKPVIVSYLLEVVEDLKAPQGELFPDSPHLTEWQVYSMIVDKLMLRDYRRSPEVAPDRRRAFLQLLAVKLSEKGQRVLHEEDLRDLTADHFQREIRRVPRESQRDEIERYFADMRGSATLTRRTEEQRSGWAFSHNSLREFLLTEHLLNRLAARRPEPASIPVSDPMRLFAGSRPSEAQQKTIAQLRTLWPQRTGTKGVGQLFSLTWNGIVGAFADEEDPACAALVSISGDPIAMNDASLQHVELSTSSKPSSLGGASFARSDLNSVSMAGADLTGADFSGTWMEAVVFSEANLSNATFAGAVLIDCEFSSADVTKADFSAVEEVGLIVESAEGGKRLSEGDEALAFLMYMGATVSGIEPHVMVRQNPNFPIVDKILSKLREQSTRQRRGLEQRGVAQRNVNFAKDFLSSLESDGFIEAPKGRRAQVHVTAKGRDMLQTFEDSGMLPDSVIELLSQKN